MLILSHSVGFFVLAHIRSIAKLTLTFCSFKAKLPILRTLSKYGLAKRTSLGILSVVDPLIEAHRQTLDPSNARDFLDVMLIEIESCQDPRSPFDPRIGLATIKNSMLDLFMAGMETTSSSLMHIFLQILHHPELQDKVHHELDTVKSLPYHHIFFGHNVIFSLTTSRIIKELCGLFGGPLFVMNCCSITLVCW